MLFLFGILTVGCRQSQSFLLQADTDRQEGLARALHALVYTQELKQGGYNLVLLFDGAGAGWAEAFRDPKNKLHAKYEKLKQMGMTEEICDFCAGAFKVKNKLKTMSDATLIAEFEGHPSLKKWMDQGYQVIIL